MAKAVTDLNHDPHHIAQPGEPLLLHSHERPAALKSPFKTEIQDHNVCQQTDRQTNKQTNKRAHGGLNPQASTCGGGGVLHNWAPAKSTPTYPAAANVQQQQQHRRIENNIF